MVSLNNNDYILFTWASEAIENWGWGGGADLSEILSRRENKTFIYPECYCLVVI